MKGIFYIDNLMRVKMNDHDFKRSCIECNECIARRVRITAKARAARKRMSKNAKKKYAARERYTDTHAGRIK